MATKVEISQGMQTAFITIEGDFSETVKTITDDIETELGGFIAKSAFIKGSGVILHQPKALDLARTLSKMGYTVTFKAIPDFESTTIAKMGFKYEGENPISNA